MIIRRGKNSGNIVWDNEKGRPLLKFNGDSYETDNEYVAEKALSLGYEVEGLPEENPGEEGLPEKPVDKKTGKANKSEKVGE